MLRKIIIKYTHENKQKSVVGYFHGFTEDLNFGTLIIIEDSKGEIKRYVMDSCSLIKFIK